MARKTYRRLTYVPGREYFFSQLPPDSQKEAELQEADFAVAFDAAPDEIIYRFMIFPNAQSREILKEHFGEHLEELLRDPQIHALVEELEGAGEMLPLLGDEGLDRALAAALLGWDLPVFQVTPPILTQREPFLSPPLHLEGRR